MRNSPEHESRDVTITNSSTTSPEIPWGHVKDAMISIPTAAVGLGTLTYYAATIPGGTALPLSTSVGVAVTQTVVAGNCYDMPAALKGCGAIRIVGNIASAAISISQKG